MGGAAIAEEAAVLRIGAETEVHHLADARLTEPGAEIAGEIEHGVPVARGGAKKTLVIGIGLPECSDELGPVTLLVNNASLFEPDGIESLAPELWERHFAVNLRAPAFLTRDFARQLPEGEEGAVVNIVDQRVWKLNPQFFSYTLSKAALLTATRTIAQALAPRIRVNAVGPGPTLTSSRQSAEDFSRQGEALPLRRHPTPEDIADAVVFLARARSVTGQMLAVDGGQHLAWETPDVLAVRE